MTPVTKAACAVNTWVHRRFKQPRKRGVKEASKGRVVVV